MHKRTDDKVCHCHECREERHKIAWSLYKKEMDQCDIAEVLGVTEGAVSQWINKAKQEGPEALRSSPRPGAERKLSEQQLKHLEGLLAEGARAYGFQGDLWTAGRVKELVREIFGVQYTQRRVQQLLEQMGWSYQKPKRKARQRDEQQIKRWVNQKWPEIKKKPEKKGE